MLGRFTGQQDNVSQGSCTTAKRTIVGTSLSSELYILANQLVRIAEQHRWSRDFTRPSLFRALREVMACFPVYRTYIRPGSDKVSDEDRGGSTRRFGRPNGVNPAMSPSFFDFIASVLLLEDPKDCPTPRRRTNAAVRAEISAGHRPGDGQRHGRHGVLSLLPAGLAR